MQGFLILEFNEEFLEQQYVPELATRHFGEIGLTTFGVAVRTAKAPYRTIYTTNANFPVSSFCARCDGEPVRFGGGGGTAPGSCAVAACERRRTMAARGAAFGRVGGFRRGPMATA